MAQLTTFATIMPLVSPLVPGVPVPVIEFCLRQATIEVCERLRCWREVVEIEAGSRDIYLPIPATSEIWEVGEMHWNGVKLTPVPTDDADVIMSQREGAPSKFTQLSSDGAFIIDPFAEGVIKAIVFLKPKQGQMLGFDPSGNFADTYNYVPKFMLQQYARAIAFGASSLICDMPNSGAYDPTRAQMLRMRFDDQIASSQARSIRGQQRAPIRTTPQWM